MLKNLIFILILIFSLQSWTKADDISDLTKLADSGNAVAQNSLGHYYLYRSDGNSEYLDKAIHYLNEAAAQEQVNAMTTVGWTYFTGEYDAPKNNDQAIYWNQRASDLGFSIASYNIGFFYYSGLAVSEQDLVKAKKYWLLCASQWIEGGNNGNSTPKGLLEEINFYNKNPNKEMIEVRDWFIDLLESMAA